MKKLYMIDGAERYLITVADTATLDNFTESATAETGGPCLGPNEIADDDIMIDYIRAHWDELDTMTAEETAEHIAHLAEEWGLLADELDYLI